MSLKWGCLLAHSSDSKRVKLPIDNKGKTVPPLRHAVANELDEFQYLAISCFSFADEAPSAKTVLLKFRNVVWRQLPPFLSELWRALWVQTVGHGSLLGVQQNMDC
jgi:hypothetical protein